MRMVDPIFQTRQKVKAWEFPFFVGRLNLLFVFRVNVEHGPGDELAAKADPDDLTLQEMTLVALEMRV